MGDYRLIQRFQSGASGAIKEEEKRLLSTDGAAPSPGRPAAFLT